MRAFQFCNLEKAQLDLGAAHGEICSPHVLYNMINPPQDSPMEIVNKINL
jgi:hypothetical protein